jgi:hypothetical protein
MKNSVSRRGIGDAARPRSDGGAPIVRASVIALAAVAWATACSTHGRDGELSATTTSAQSALKSSPELPSIMRDVAVHRDDGKAVTPTIRNKVSTSNDGRLAIAGNKIVLHSPEKLGAHFWQQSGGEPLDGGSFEFDASWLHGGGVDHQAGGPALCDGTRQFNLVDKRNQPYACDADDCYDLTVITPVFRGAGQARRMRLWGLGITVRVASPKTAAARIKSITKRSEPVGGIEFAVRDFFEPNVTGDGKLLVGRVGGSLLDGEERINIVYAMQTGDTTCDVNGWTELKAITRAYEDPPVRDRYGFARTPFRDTEGNVIPAGQDLRATYPWLDREGRNLFVKTGARPLYYEAADGVATSSFPARCVTGVACDPTAAHGLTEEVPQAPNGVAVLGQWTHGRMVLLDGRVNHADFGLGIKDKFHREVKLYAGAGGWVRVGSGRKLDDLGDVGGNTGHIQSPEQLFNFRASMRPRTPRDVVWLLSTQLTTEEIVFDDWVDPHALIVSDMMPSWKHNDAGQAVYRDGFADGAGFDGTAELHLQNAATAPESVLKTPAFGRLEGPARAEPVALGGIFGRGFWLTGDNRVKYRIPTQDRTLADTWFTSIFVDARVPDDNLDRRLLTFSDDTGLVMVGRKKLSIRDSAGAELMPVELPASLQFGDRGYHHIALRKVGTKLEVLFDGLVIDSKDVGGALGFPGGEKKHFVVGKRAGEDMPGVRGWIDELRVFNEAVGDELACNHARGSIVGLTGDAPTALVNVAKLYPRRTHNAISDALPADKKQSKYLCMHDYSRETTKFSFESDVPSGAVWLRAALITPRPLRYDAPRPDDTGNAFCLTCHVVGQTPSLSVDALALDPDTSMQDDRRRQPMQAPRRMFGWLPKDFIAPGLPASTKKAPSKGLSLDELLFPK